MSVRVWLAAVTVCAMASAGLAQGPGGGGGGGRCQSGGGPPGGGQGVMQSGGQSVMRGGGSPGVMRGGGGGGQLRGGQAPAALSANVPQVSQLQGQATAVNLLAATASGRANYARMYYAAQAKREAKLKAELQAGK